MTDDLDHIRGLRPDAPLLDSADLDAPRAVLMGAMAHPQRSDGSARPIRWRQPALASLAVAAIVAAVVVVSGQGFGTHHRPAAAPAAPTSPSGQATAATGPSTATAAGKPASSAAVSILHDAAARLRGKPRIPTPDPNAFYYFRTTRAQNWISINGERAGEGRNTGGGSGTATWPGCKNGQDVTPGESGPCTAHPSYLGDAPTTAARWPAYIDQDYFPGAITNDAAGKAVYQLLYTNLLQPGARAALLDWVATCNGVTTRPVAPVDGQQLVGVTCPGLQYLTIVFSAADHHLAGTIWYETGPAELWLQTGVVPAIGDRP